MMNANMCLSILLLNFFTVASCSQGIQAVKAENISLSELPEDLSFQGDVKATILWSDSSGENLALISETGEYLSENVAYDSYRDAQLFAYHYLLKNDSSELGWKMQDFVIDCPVDIKASFINEVFQVTDLNEDGIAEIWIMYSIACRGDVSPADMKLIMYQGGEKFAMKGRSKVQYGATEFEGGDYVFDDAFLQGDVRFMDFAKQLWTENVLENW